MAKALKLLAKSGKTCRNHVPCFHRSYTDAEALAQLHELLTLSGHGIEPSLPVKRPCERKIRLAADKLSAAHDLSRNGLPYLPHPFCYNRFYAQQHNIA